MVALHAWQHMLSLVGDWCCSATVTTTRCEAHAWEAACQTASPQAVGSLHNVRG